MGSILRAGPPRLLLRPLFLLGSHPHHLQVLGLKAQQKGARERARRSWRVRGWGTAKEARGGAGTCPVPCHPSLLGEVAGRSKTVRLDKLPYGGGDGSSSVLCHWVAAEPGLGKAAEREKQTLWLHGDGG